MKKDTEITRKVEALIADMSIKEKIGQLCFVNGERDPELPFIESVMPGTVANLSGAALSNEIQKRVVAASPHNIPALMVSDVIQGYRTIFPIPLAEACSFDPALAENNSRIAATEANLSGVSWTMAPMVDIARDPRWGRIAEGAGEDTYLCGVMGAARTRGINSAGGIGGCVKHYCAYGNAEGGRDYNAAQINENELRNVYLPPFKACVEAGIDGVMPSFNTTLGVPMTCNKYLLSGVLRGEFGFEGCIATDYNAMDELINHGVAEDRYHACRLAFDSTVDVDMGSLIYMNDLQRMLDEGLITEDDIDEGVRRVLYFKFKLGLFDRYLYDTEKESALTLCPEYRAAAKDAARKSTVLLKNESNTLPLSENQKILLTGPLGDDGDAPLGWWRCKGRAEDTTTLFAGMKQLSDKVEFIKGCDVLGDGEIDFDAVKAAAKASDIIVCAVGEPSFMSGESHSRGEITLPGRQREYVKFLSTLNKPLVLVLISGRTHDISEENALSDAVLCPWEFGISGDGVAEVLFGKYNPSAKLCVSFPNNVGQIPLYYSHTNTGRPYKGAKIEMSKSVKSFATDFTSYYIDMPVTPLYPFGHGLSYTSFEYSSLSTDKAEYSTDESVTVAFTLKNTGEREGCETAQVYVRDIAASVARPVKELKGFEKVTLAPGEEKRVTLTLSKDAFSFYNFRNEYVLEPGKFEITVGGDSVSGDSVMIEFTE